MHAPLKNEDSGQSDLGPDALLEAAEISLLEQLGHGSLYFASLC